MAWFDSLKQYIQNLEESTFNKILMGIIISIALLFIFGVVRYYWKTSSLSKEIRLINSKRRTVKEILDRKEAVIQQQKEVDEILDADPDFRIRTFIDNLLAKFTIKATVKSPETRDIEQGTYEENTINMQFIGIKMKQLVQLLEEAEKEQRIYTKNIEVNKSKKTPKAIDVNITFATLVKKEI